MAEPSRRNNAMDKQAKMKRLVEASGNIVYERYADNGQLSHYVTLDEDGDDIPVPSPDDLNALFEIAEKLECHELEFWFFSVSASCKFKPLNAANVFGNGATPSEALLNALIKAIGDK